PYRPGTVPDAPVERAKSRVREQLARAGFFEARTVPLGPADGPDAVALVNPISSEETHLRTRLLPGLVRRVEHNWANRNRDIRLFEIGTAFRLKDSLTVERKGLPEERIRVAAVLTGARHPPHWREGAKVPGMDLWDLKHHFELAVGLACPSARVQVAAGKTGWEAVTGTGEAVGWAGALRADAPVWAAPLFGLEVDLAMEAGAGVGAGAPLAYRPLPVHPPVERDLALVLPGGVTAAAVADVV